MIVRYYTIGLIVASGLAPLVQAQSGIAQRRTDPVQREQQRHFELQMIEAKLERGQLRPSARKSPQVLAQIKEDFLHIQVLDRKLRQTTSATQALSFGTTAKSVSEIKKRAVRLKSSLALPGAEEIPEIVKMKPATEPEQVRSSLSALSDSIYEFVSNPFFLSAKVVNTRMSAKARQDLEQIIALSSHIKRSSEKLKIATRRK
jgi:hypothetical protein